VLLLEAGAEAGLSPEGYRAYIERYQSALIKVPNSPYPPNPNAPSPSVLDVDPLTPGHVADKGYLVQRGPHPFRSDYLRAPGGTTLHWMGTCLRLLPNDFRMRSEYGHGVDWPIAARDLEPHYAAAEREIGVSGSADEQRAAGLPLPEGYVYPMRKIPQ